MRGNLIGINEALAIHLQYNHYPPVSLQMVGPCKRAIAYCNKGEYDHKVRCPGDLIPAWKIVDDLHLDEWLTGED